MCQLRCCTRSVPQIYSTGAIGYVDGGNASRAKTFWAAMSRIEKEKRCPEHFHVLLVEFRRVCTALQTIAQGASQNSPVPRHEVAWEWISTLTNQEGRGEDQISWLQPGEGVGRTWRRRQNNRAKWSQWTPSPSSSERPECTFKNQSR